MKDKAASTAPDASNRSNAGDKNTRNSPSSPSAASDACSRLSSTDDEGASFGTIEPLRRNPAIMSSGKKKQVSGFSARWTHAIHQIHRPILRVLHFLTRVSATNPKMTITGVISLSFFLLLVGLNTNFVLNVEQTELWTPQHSLALEHATWLADESGFIDFNRAFIMWIHADGKNVLTQEYFNQVFEVMDTLTGVEGFDEACTGTDYEYDGKETCEMSSPTRFWWFNSSIYQFEISDDEELREALSAVKYPDGSYVDENGIMGDPKRDNVTNVLQSALSYVIAISLPEHQAAKDWELRALNRILDLIEEWEDDPTKIVVTVQSTQGWVDEFLRGIITDLPLVPIVFFIMSIFTCIVFARKNRVFSRCFLGFGAVVAVLLSIVAGYGLLFICGVHFTS